MKSFLLPIYRNLNGINTIEDGNVYTAVECLYKKNNTSGKMKYKFYKNMPYVDLDVEILFNETDRTVKLEIPLSSFGKFIGQTVFGSEELCSDGKEVSAHRYVAVETDSGKYFAVLNNCVYAFSLKDNKLFITLLRGATYCAHPIGDRQLIPTDRYVDKIEAGIHNFSFRLIVCNRNELDKYANEFNKKTYSLNCFPTETKKTNRPIGLEISNKNIVVSSLRKRKNVIICRLFNGTGEETCSMISFNGVKAEIHFRNNEIKLFSISDVAIEEIEEKF